MSTTKTIDELSKTLRRLRTQVARLERERDEAIQRANDQEVSLAWAMKRITDLTRSGGTNG